MARSGGTAPATMAAQEATARWTNSVKVSTLVLINDAEYDLEVSTGHLTLANWGQHGEVGDLQSIDSYSV